MHHKLEWERSERHTWWASPDSIKRGSWCPVCVGRNKTIADMQELAHKIGAKCLSTEYVNMQHKLEWECSNVHTWWAVPNNVKQGHWCPVCVGSVHEEQCRIILETLTGEKFPKVSNVFGTRMHFDGFCEELKLAFEYDGVQHFKFVKHWHRNQTGLAKQKARDKLKNELCEKNNVRMIRIPYTEDNNIEGFIGNWLDDYRIPRTGKEIDWLLFWARNNNQLEECKKYAKKRGGKCLSAEYVGAHKKMEWQCSKGHTWLATSSNVKRGTWCPVCVGRNKTIEDMHELARKKGGKCLSSEYVNCGYKLEWQCAEGHRWMADLNHINHIKNSTWCPKCATKRNADEQRNTIEDMHELAHKRGGKCISTKYVNNYSKLKWECANGHTWWAVPNNIKNAKTWCPKCGDTLKKTIEEIHELAHKRGGKCLSTEYVNAYHELEWECLVGHVWETFPKDIKRGPWCPQCKLNHEAAYNQVTFL